TTAHRRAEAWAVADATLIDPFAPAAWSTVPISTGARNRVRVRAGHRSAIFRLPPLTGEVRSGAPSPGGRAPPTWLGEWGCRRRGVLLRCDGRARPAT